MLSPCCGSGWTPFNEYYKLPDVEPLFEVDEEGNPIEGSFIYQKDTPELTQRQKEFVDSLLLNEKGPLHEDQGGFRW